MFHLLLFTLIATKTPFYSNFILYRSFLISHPLYKFQPIMRQKTEKFKPENGWEKFNRTARNMESFKKKEIGQLIRCVKILKLEVPPNPFDEEWKNIDNFLKKPCKKFYWKNRRMF